MRKAIFLCFMCFSAAVLYAHPAKEMSISYDKETKILNVNIIHQVRNPKSHFINKIEISVNNKNALTHLLRYQEDSEGQQLQYRLSDIEPNDKISVNAACSVSGRLKKEITAQ